MANTTTDVSRLVLTHPDIGYEGGAALHNFVRQGWIKIGDAINGRYFTEENLADAASVDFTHNFKVAFSELKPLLYSWDTGTDELTRIVSGGSPDLDDFTIEATPGNLTTQIRVTNNTGGDQDIALVVLHGKGAESIDELNDVDISTTPPEEGQALVWETDKFVPGASGDSSFKFQAIDGTDLTIKSGFIILSDGRELNLASDLTYDLSGITIDGDYYGYIDLLSLPAQTTINGREVYNITSSNFSFVTVTPDDINLGRYVPIGAIQRATGTWQNPVTLAVRRHDTSLGTDGSLEYQKAYAAVGDVGDADNFKAGHVLVAASFPSGLTTELSFYNLEDANDDSTNSRNLTNNGTTPFTATGIKGNSNSAAALNGTTQYFNSSNSHFNTNDTDHSFGGWFKADDWATPGGLSTLFSQYVATGDQRSWLMRLNDNSLIRIDTSVDGINIVSSEFSHAITGNDWHHLAFVYDSTSNIYSIYIDGVFFNSHAVGGNLHLSTTPDFGLGAISGGSQLFAGDIDEVFFISGQALTENQIHKIYSHKLSHNRLMTAQSQDWLAWVKSGAIELPLKNYIVDMDTNDLYVDFSDQLSTNEIELKLFNVGSVGLAKSSKTRSIELTASELDALLPITHSLGVVPEISFKVENASNKFEGHFWGNYFLATATQIELAGDTLENLLGASTNVILNFSTATISQFVPTKLWNSISASSAQAINAWDEVFADTSGGAFALTLPGSPSIGDRVRVIDSTGSFDSFTLTISRNGNNIQGVAADLTLSTEGDSVELVFNGIDDWRMI